MRYARIAIAFFAITVLFLHCGCHFFVELNQDAQYFQIIGNKMIAEEIHIIPQYDITNTERETSCDLIIYAAFLLSFCP